MTSILKFDGVSFAPHFLHVYPRGFSMSFGERRSKPE